MGLGNSLSQSINTNSITVGQYVLKSNQMKLVSVHNKLTKLIVSVHNWFTKKVNNKVT